MANLYEVFYEHTELRRAGVIADSKAEAIDKFHDGDYEDDDGKESLKTLVKSVDLIEENVQGGR